MQPALTTTAAGIDPNAAGIDPNAAGIDPNAAGIDHECSLWAALQTERDCFRQLADDPAPHRVERSRHAEAGRVLVAAAAVPARDRPDVDVVLRSHAHADLAVRRGLEEHHRLDLA